MQKAPMPFSRLLFSILFHESRHCQIPIRNLHHAEIYDQIRRHAGNRSQPKIHIASFKQYSGNPSDGTLSSKLKHISSSDVLLAHILYIVSPYPSQLSLPQTGEDTSKSPPLFALPSLRPLPQPREIKSASCHIRRIALNPSNYSRHGERLFRGKCLLISRYRNRSKVSHPAFTFRAIAGFFLLRPFVFYYKTSCSVNNSHCDAVLEFVVHPYLLSYKGNRPALCRGGCVTGTLPCSRLLLSASLFPVIGKFKMQRILLLIKNCAPGIAFCFSFFVMP